MFHSPSVTALIRRSIALSTAALGAPLVAASAQQADISLSPFVTFMPTGGASPLAGLALTMAGNSGLALRASGHLSLENTNSNSFNAPTLRPWGADVDAVLFLGGRGAGTRRAIAPYVFAGLGTAGVDSFGTTEFHNNWSYGAGFSVPVTGALDLFGETRWRMSQYVLPTARFAPAPTNELRFGISLHFGGLSSRNSGLRSSGRRAEVPVSAASTTYPASRTASASAVRLLSTADEYVGVQYVWGGTTPGGFDCSGFTQYVFAKQGVRLPRTSREQAQVGLALSPEWRAIAPGDLVMFAENGPISHVAIYAGRNRIIHASSSGGGVRYDDLSTQRGEWFVDHMVAARRVTADSRGLMVDLAKSFSEIGIQLDGPDHAPKPGAR